MLTKLRQKRLPVGLRTLKTALAVAAAMLLVERYGTGADGLIFGVMGAFYAMEPTFKASVRSCLAQISGVVIGVILAVFLELADLPGIVTAGVGIILTMAIYQIFRWRTSPVLPCLIFIILSTSPETEPWLYGCARIWNTLLGMGVGFLINMLIFPYNNSRQIRRTLAGLDEDLRLYLEDRFDGDDHLPGTGELERKIDSLEAQLAIFADQRLLFRRKQKRELENLRSCEDIARALLVEIEVLRSMEGRGRLNGENLTLLRELGPAFSAAEPAEEQTAADVVVNYHVSRILFLRRKLLESLEAEEQR